MSAKLLIPRDKLETQLRQSLERYEKLRIMPTATTVDRNTLLAAFKSWDEHNKRLIENSFTPVRWHEGSPKSDYADLQDLEFLSSLDLDEDKAGSLLNLAAEKSRKILSLIDSLPLFELEVATEDPTSITEQAGVIFLVHGRDLAAREKVRRILEKVTDLSVIVLSDEASSGSTIVEKVGTHIGSSAYAVVLMTADDEGRLKGDPQLFSRARQNVVLELGYVLAALGRANIAILREDGVEIPSDVQGINYIIFDAGDGWMLRLVQELKAAGINADANKILP